MSDFVERMKAEVSELKAKMDKLAAFIGTDTFNGLHNFERLLLEEQLEAMTTYHRLLSKRLALHLHG